MKVTIDLSREQVVALLAWFRQATGEDLRHWEIPESIKHLQIQLEIATLYHLGQAVGTVPAEEDDGNVDLYSMLDSLLGPE